MTRTDFLGTVIQGHPPTHLPSQRTASASTTGYIWVLNTQHNRPFPLAWACQPGPSQPLEFNPASRYALGTRHSALGTAHCDTIARCRQAAHARASCAALAQVAFSAPPLGGL